MYEEERRRDVKDVSLGCQSDEIVNEGLESPARVAVFLTKQVTRERKELVSILYC